MTRTIVKLSVHRTALIGAVVGAILALVLVLLILPFTLFVPRTAEASPVLGIWRSGIMLILMPVVYFVMVYIFSAIWVLVFNLVAPRLGGVPVTFGDEGPAATL